MYNISLSKYNMAVKRYRYHNPAMPLSEENINIIVYLLASVLVTVLGSLGVTLKAAKRGSSQHSELTRQLGSLQRTNSRAFSSTSASTQSSEPSESTKLSDSCKESC